MLPPRLLAARESIRDGRLVGGGGGGGGSGAPPSSALTTAPTPGPVDMRAGMSVRLDACCFKKLNAFSCASTLTAAAILASPDIGGGGGGVGGGGGGGGAGAGVVVGCLR